MKKVISVREIIIVMISVMLIVCATEVFAADPNFVLRDPQTVSPEDYQNAKVPNAVDQGNNAVGNNAAGNNTTGNNAIGNNKTGNDTKVYNTNNTTGLPQTGIEYY